MRFNQSRIGHFRQKQNQWFYDRGTAFGENGVDLKGAAEIFIAERRDVLTRFSGFLGKRSRPKHQ
mgnify:FL=1